MNIEIAKWLGNYQAPCVLMIDDLSDAYIDKYPESHLNDWGYLGSKNKASSFFNLNEQLIRKFPYIKITFFIPYKKHSVIADDSNYKIFKYALGERVEYTDFLKELIGYGHEVAHHGSNHGCYEGNIWIQEWCTYRTFDEGLTVTRLGIDKFKEHLGVEILGGKYCGYKYNSFSHDIIEASSFTYWCSDAKFFIKNDGRDKLDSYEFIDFPTTIPGNVFVKYKYKTENRIKDNVKFFLGKFQIFYSILSEFRIRKLVSSRSILSIQEHFSPSTTRGIVQSANIHSDMKSLIRIFKILKKYDIWYATCADISTYIDVATRSVISISGNEVNIIYSGNIKTKNKFITLISDESFSLESELNGSVFHTQKKSDRFFVTLPILIGENCFSIVEV